MPSTDMAPFVRSELRLLVHMCFPEEANRRQALAAVIGVGQARSLRALADGPDQPLFTGLDEAAKTISCLAYQQPRPSRRAPPHSVEITLSGPRLPPLLGRQALARIGGLEAVAEAPSPSSLPTALSNVFAKEGITVGLIMMNLARLNAHSPSQATLERAMHLLHMHKMPGIPHKPNTRDAIFGHPRTQKEYWKRFRPVVHLWASTINIAYSRYISHKNKTSRHINISEFIMNCVTDVDQRNVMIRQARWFADFASSHFAQGAANCTIPLDLVDFFDQSAPPEQPYLFRLTAAEVAHLATYQNKDS